MFDDAAELEEEPGNASEKNSRKINYREKNLVALWLKQEHIERLKEKRQKEFEEREREEKKEQALRDKLKRKILEEALKVREAKEKQNRENGRQIMVESVPKKEKRHQAQSLPKVFPSMEQKE